MTTSSTTLTMAEQLVPDEVWAVTCLPTNVMVKVKDAANDPHARVGECLPFLTDSFSLTDCGTIFN